METENKKSDIDYLVSLNDRGKHDQVIEIVDRLENPSEEHLLCKTEAMNSKGEGETALKILKALNKSEDDWVRIQALRQTSAVFWFTKNDNETAYKFIQQAHQLLSVVEIQTKGQKKIKAHVLHMRGSIIWHQNDFIQAKKLLEKSLEISKELNDKQRIASTSGNLGVILRDMGELQKSLDCILLAKENFEELGNKEGIAVGLGMVGYSYFSLV